MTGRPRTMAALFVGAVVLPVAALSRLWAIDFCLPHPHCRPDEDAIMAIAGAFRTGHFDPEAFNYPALFMLAVAAVMAVPTIGERLLHKITPFHFSPLLSDELTTAKYTLTARGLSAAAGIASVWIVFRLGLRLFDRAAAVAGASLLALAFLHVRDSHYGVTDVAMSFMVLVAVLCAVRLSQSGARRDLVLAGIAAGLAASTKYNGGLVALPVLFAVFVNPAAKSLGARVADAAIAAGLMAAAFLCASPYTVIEFRRFWNDFSSDAMHLSFGHGLDLGRGWIYHAKTTLRYGVGYSSARLGCGGYAAAALARRPQGRARGALSRRLLRTPGQRPHGLHAPHDSGRAVSVSGRGILPRGERVVARRVDKTSGVARGHDGRRRRSRAVAVRAFGGDVRLASRARRSRLIVRRWIEQRFPAGTTIAQIAPDGGVVFWHDPSEVAYTTMVDLPRTGARPAVVIVQSSPLRPPRDNMGAVEAVLKAIFSRLRPARRHRGSCERLRSSGRYIPAADWLPADRAAGPNLDV